MITLDDFSKIDMHIGTVVRAEAFPEARKPAIKLWVDFGELGVRKSSAQITDLYAAEMLLGKQVVAVTNFPPRQIGTFMSECLILGCLGNDKKVVLLRPDMDVPNGWKVS
ncbi:MAG: tRNA-binding protein [Bacteroidia bacterium]